MCLEVHFEMVTVFLSCTFNIERLPTLASEEVSSKAWIYTSYVPGRHEDGRKANCTWLQVREWWRSRILSEKSNSTLDCEQLLSEFSPEGKVQHVKVMFKLTGVHWTITDKIYKQQKRFQVYSKSIQWGMIPYSICNAINLYFTRNRRKFLNNCKNL